MQKTLTDFKTNYKIPLELGFVQADKIESVRIVDPIGAKGITKKPSDYMLEAKTVISLAMPVDMLKEYYQFTVSLKDPYRGYGDIYDVSKALCTLLIKKGYKAKVANKMNQKLCAVEAGHGVVGKNSLLISSTYGTRLRLATVVTDYEPENYNERLNKNLCESCKLCVTACKHNCLAHGFVNSVVCNNNYIDKNMLTLNKKYMCNVCQIVCPYNKDYVNNMRITKIEYN